MNIGNISGYATSVIFYAVATDTGAIYYDADGDWTNHTDCVAIGTITGIALTTTNYTVA